jgi:hypothetical protein
LSDQSPEPALVQHLIKTKSVGKQARGLGSQKQPFDVDVAFGHIGRHDQEAQPIHAALKPAIGLFAWNHGLPYHSLHTCANAEGAISIRDGRISTFGGWFSNPAEMRPAVDTGAFRVDFPLHRFQNEMKVGQETIL